MDRHLFKLVFCFFYRGFGWQTYQNVGFEGFYVDIIFVWNWKFQFLFILKSEFLILIQLKSEILILVQTEIEIFRISNFIIKILINVNQNFLFQFNQNRNFRFYCIPYSYKYCPNSIILKILNSTPILKIKNVNTWCWETYFIKYLEVNLVSRTDFFIFFYKFF